MGQALRRQRVGVKNAAAMLGIPTGRLRQALREDRMLRGKPMPEPVVLHGGTTRNQPYWEIGSLMDFLDQERP